MKVTIELDELAELHTTAKLSEYRGAELDRVKKENANLAVECERQAKEINQLKSSIMEAEKELAAWNTAKNATQPEADARAYLAEHNTPFEDNDVDKACVVIRALLARTPEPAKPREVSPLLRQRIENAKDVLCQITPIVANSDGSFDEVAGDRFNVVYKTLTELYDVLRVEVQ